MTHGRWLMGMLLLGDNEATPLELDTPGRLAKVDVSEGFLPQVVFFVKCTL